MLNPVIRTYRLPPGMRPPAAGAVLPKGALAGLTASEEMIAATEAHCADLVARAAEKLEAERVTAVRDTECSVWDRALPLLEAMQSAREAVLEEAESLLMNAVRVGLQSLLLDVPAEWSGLSSSRLLLRELRELQGSEQAKLHAHPDDLAAIRADALHGISVDWIADTTLERGQCLLVCGQGELRADFEASVVALVDSLGRDRDSSLSQEEI